jgi:hypothetical protein
MAYLLGPRQDFGKRDSRLGASRLADKQFVYPYMSSATLLRSLQLAMHFRRG